MPLMLFPTLMLDEGCQILDMERMTIALGEKH